MICPFLLFREDVNEFHDFTRLAQGETGNEFRKCVSYVESVNDAEDSCWLTILATARLKKKTQMLVSIPFSFPPKTKEMVYLNVYPEVPLPIRQVVKVNPPINKLPRAMSIAKGRRSEM